MLDADMDYNLLKRILDIYDPDYIWLPSNQLENFVYNELVFTALTFH